MVAPAAQETLGARLRAAAARLEGVCATARLDAEVLLAHTLQRDRAYLRAHLDDPLPPPAASAYAQLVARRAQGVPVAYLTGVQEFWSLPLRVSEAALVPRADTELLVELALQLLPPEREAAVADLGTGTGAVAIALARERPRARMVATEACAAARALAQSNIERWAPGGVDLRAARSGWFDALHDERYDLILSNPPYIAAHDPHLEADGVRYEPRLALVSGPDGLDALRAIIAGAAAHLHGGGWLLLEHGFQQGEAVRALLSAHGYVEVATHADLAGQPRVSAGRRAG
ncbi:peptide chain release factor N(5)-glutamine methyltransferase [Ectothiorhodospiraceae bacterium 2226]|nr:peptide chain release factor N(5)-glutamine methyltransferase [Ectothiorhodospiraceae bacterium 2226]